MANDALHEVTFPESRHSSPSGSDMDISDPESPMEAAKDIHTEDRCHAAIAVEGSRWTSTRPVFRSGTLTISFHPEEYTKSSEAGVHDVERGTKPLSVGGVPDAQPGPEMHDTSVENCTDQSLPTFVTLDDDDDNNSEDVGVQHGKTVSPHSPHSSLSGDGHGVSQLPTGSVEDLLDPEVLASSNDGDDPPLWSIQEDVLDVSRDRHDKPRRLVIAHKKTYLVTSHGFIDQVDLSDARSAHH